MHLTQRPAPRNGLKTTSTTMNTTRPTQKAFVYTEVQISIPFEQVPWRELDPLLKQQPGPAQENLAQRGRQSFRRRLLRVRLARKRATLCPRLFPRGGQEARRAVHAAHLRRRRHRRSQPRHEVAALRLIRPATASFRWSDPAGKLRLRTHPRRFTGDGARPSKFHPRTVAQHGHVPHAGQHPRCPAR